EPSGALPAPEVSGLETLPTGGELDLVVRWAEGEPAPDRIEIASREFSGYYVLPVTSESNEQVVKLALPNLAPSMDGVPFDVKIRAILDAGEPTKWEFHSVVPKIVGTGSVQVSLTWAAPVDLDLKVIEPGGKVIDTDQLDSSTGKLDTDANRRCDLDAAFVENAFWSPGTEPDGTYTVRANLWGACDYTQPINYVLKVKACGRLKTIDGWIDPSTADPQGAGVELGTFDVDCAYHVHGKVSYEKRMLASPTFTVAPARFAQVRVLRATDNRCLAVGQTDAEGNYDLRFSNTGDPRYVVVADAQWGRSFEPSSEGECPKLRPLAEVTGKTGDEIYSSSSPELQGLEQDFQFDLRIPEIFDSGAFNILDVMVQGFNWTTAMVGDNVPKLRARWSRGQETFIKGTSYYDAHGELKQDPKNDCIYIKGPADNTDEFDDTVIAHEFMHHVMTTLIGRGPGGSHGPYLQVEPRLAFHEGTATALGSYFLGVPAYLDSSFKPGWSVWNIGVETIDTTAAGRTFRAGTDDKTQSGKVSESLVSYVIWDLLDSGSKEAHDLISGSERETVSSLFHYLPHDDRDDRGADGEDLVDLLDGWRCEDRERVSGTGLENRDRELRTLLVDTHQFPYDFEEPECP
ncbi:MAG TPA: hypothetical protein VM493_02475, partial [Vicinamibacterales bacterium]|nr:hypothetical protein [Vicinamibacterales bacterium]